MILLVRADYNYYEYLHKPTKYIITGIKKSINYFKILNKSEIIYIIYIKNIINKIFNLI